jgi:prepilin-type N-terminal cleavage/methylation domain-containing protein
VGSDRRRSGFTLLEVMVTMAIVGGALVTLLISREKAVNDLIETRNNNWARQIAREMLTELEFHELDRYSGQLDQYPGFSFDIHVEDIDLVTGEGDADAEEREREKKEKRLSNEQQGDADSRFKPGDLLEDEEGQEELVYPVRKVKLRVEWPNMSGADGAEPNKLEIEAILPQLPEFVKARSEQLDSPFETQR